MKQAKPRVQLGDPLAGLGGLSATVRLDEESDSKRESGSNRAPSLGQARRAPGSRRHPAGLPLNALEAQGYPAPVLEEARRGDRPPKRSAPRYGGAEATKRAAERKRLAIDLVLLAGRSDLTINLSTHVRALSMNWADIGSAGDVEEKYNNEFVAAEQFFWSQHKAALAKKATDGRAAPVKLLVKFAQVFQREG